jgi:hypothetical protein
VERLGPFFKHPLVLLALGGLFTAILIPQVTREWQDRQSEQEIKRTLLEEIASSATTAVRQANSLAAACAEPAAEPPSGDAQRVCAPLTPSEAVRAAGGEAGEPIGEIYAVLRNSWLIRRATARSRITTYFPGVYSCWYSYERAVADYIGLITQDPRTKRARVENLQAFVDTNLTRVYGLPEAAETGCVPLGELPPSVRARYTDLKEAMRWRAVNYPTWSGRFKQEYAKLGEIVEIAMERIITTITKAQARGFSHGIDVPLF